MVKGPSNMVDGAKIVVPKLKVVDIDTSKDKVVLLKVAGSQLVNIKLWFKGSQTLIGGQK